MEILVARSANDIEQAYERLSVASVLGCDTETSGLNPSVGSLLSIQFSDGAFCVLLPFSEGVAMGKLAEILLSRSITKIFHNARFDLEFLRSAGIETNNVYDTMIAEKVLTRGANQSASLAETLYRYFAVDLDKSQRSKFNRRWDGIWTEDLVDYALSDVVHLPRLMQEQMAWMEKLDLSDNYAGEIQKVFARLEEKALD